ncbi:NADH dehydrogenase (ubiquinone) 1 alpha/beta subcomplex 1 [[Emmonsia] crescens]|uniref:Acyl carrier protein n=1 Tax=[Emmonsia] crescens TaxID=73230 RepID=A0A0G2JC13_9EURO|nr:NADH dehydrogenase (ubiquinone) 1 alpha/beta subcomplex 1 [Emmonsia crescens UAMH 3008]
MFRSAIARSLRAASSIPRTVRPSGASFQISRSPLSAARAAQFQFSPSFTCQAIRSYSAPAGLTQSEIEGRIVDLLKNFDKVSDPSKITGTSHFSNDLGLDSLDTVEVVMAIEEEFSIEIPDKEADAIHSTRCPLKGINPAQDKQEEGDSGYA